MIFRLSPLAVFPFVEVAGRAAGQVGDNKAGVDAVWPGLDAGDDPLDPAPAAGAVEKLLVAALFLGARRGGAQHCGAPLQHLDMTAQRRRRGNAENEIQALGAAEVEQLRCAVVAVRADQDLDPRPVAPGWHAPGGAGKRGPPARSAASPGVAWR